MGLLVFLYPFFVFVPPPSSFLTLSGKTGLKLGLGRRFKSSSSREVRFFVHGLPGRECVGFLENFSPVMNFEANRISESYSGDSLLGAFSLAFGEERGWALSLLPGPG